MSIHCTVLGIRSQIFCSYIIEIYVIYLVADFVSIHIQTKEKLLHYSTKNMEFFMGDRYHLHIHCQGIENLGLKIYVL